MAKWQNEEWGQGCLAASLMGCLRAPGVSQILQKAPQHAWTCTLWVGGVLFSWVLINW